jgi:hypothetical protein
MAVNEVESFSRTPMSSFGCKAGFLLAAVVAAGCDAGNRPLGDCADDAATYACSAVPVDAGGCEAFGPDGAAVFYPMGCVGTFPGCATTGSGPLTCTCTYNYGFGGLDAQTAFVCAN